MQRLHPERGQYLLRSAQEPGYVTNLRVPTVMSRVGQ